MSRCLALLLLSTALTTACDPDPSGNDTNTTGDTGDVHPLCDANFQSQAEFDGFVSYRGSTTCGRFEAPELTSLACLLDGADGGDGGVDRVGESAFDGATVVTTCYEAGGHFFPE